MKLRKLFAMTIAAIMAVSTMAISVSAEEPSTATLMPGYTYNEETGELDFGYKYVEEISDNLSRNPNGFRFSQTLGTSMSTLVNIIHDTATPNVENDEFWLSGKNVFTIKFDDNVSTIPMYYMTVKNIATGATLANNIRFYAPSCYFENLPIGSKYSIQMRVGSGNVNVSGEVLEAKITQ